ncbi:hypothetical protein AAFF27_11390 [Xylophilus sp. GW821-FHT01B05]
MRLPHSHALHAPASPGPHGSGWAGRTLAGILRMGRAPAVLAVGDTVDVPDEGERSRQALRRLATLNPRLDIVDACQPAAGLAEAASAAREAPRRNFDLAVVFLGNAEVLRLASCCRYAPVASDALASLGMRARQVFVITAFDAAQLAREEAGDITRPLQRRHQWLCRTLRDLCAQHGVELLDLSALPVGDREEGGASRAGSEAWTTRMLQRPALAHLVFG